MIFVKSFKGYEDRLQEIDSAVNEWIQQAKVDIVDIKPVLSHEHESRARSGDLVYVVLYKSDKPVA